MCLDKDAPKINYTGSINAHKLCVWQKMRKIELLVFDALRAIEKEDFRQLESTSISIKEISDTLDLSVKSWKDCNC